MSSLPKDPHANNEPKGVPDKVKKEKTNYFPWSCVNTHIQFFLNLG